MPSQQQFANAIRVLSMDAVQRAGSGHPGAPMGMADIADVLWNRYLVHNPDNPDWVNRDRFVLSNGHGSMLLYSLLHLSGYDLPIEEVKNFRQLHSKTPGHPEFGYTPGVDTTTGPLGQGIANAVGMALAEKTLAGQFNRPDFDVVDHYTYAFLGDGCLMEGISHEVCSLAGTLKLGKLIAFYDDNGISIDGEVEGWFTDDTAQRFKSYHWQVIDNVDGHCPGAIADAIEQARLNTDQPTLICCRTVIGKGSPNKQGSEACHGAPLGEAEIEATRIALDWPHKPFSIPKEVYSHWDARKEGKLAEQKWQQLVEAYQQQYPELHAEFTRRVNGELPQSFTETALSYIRDLQNDGASIASRKASQNCLNTFAPQMPELLGGSADLAGSNLTLWSGCQAITDNDAAGNYVHYGVREFGMAAIMSGVALHGGFIPYGATFLTFMDYARNAVRMAALMQQRSIFVFTHDSIGLGEDGPTHQPVEHLANLRSTPNMETWRPCDTVESAVAWQQAILRRNGPSSLIFSRQALAHQSRSEQQVLSIQRGGYVLSDSDSTPQAILIATGSEVEIAITAAQQLNERGVDTRVVSMPCTERFDAQPQAYRESVLPADVRLRVAIEAAHADFWYKYVGLDGDTVALRSFGESAPATLLYEHFGITVDNVVDKVMTHMARGE